MRIKSNSRPKISSGTGVPLNILKMQDVINKNRGEIRTSFQNNRPPRISVSPKRQAAVNGGVSTYILTSSRENLQQSMEVEVNNFKEDTPLKAKMSSELQSTDKSNANADLEL